ncbi:MAG: ArsB/NhaD family transporter [Spirochaetales bacterium]|nr:ArsB/NhaD family transporter [Spirochaetales bacterium]
MVHIILAVVIFVLAFVVISFEWMNKTIIVLLGAVVYLLTGILSQHRAFESVDWNVIFLLVGMMIIVGISRESGMFQYIAVKAAKIAKGEPIRILLLLSVITAIISAVLDNVTTILIITPVSILIAIELGLSPVPFIISNAIASNIGGTATLIGDPPNILIGSAAGFSFADFIVNVAPAAGIALAVYALVFYLLFRKKLKVSREQKARIMDFDEMKTITDRGLLIKSVSVIVLTVVGFTLHGVFHLEPATIAIAGAVLLMILTREHDVDRFFKEVEWGTIFFFIGLFILVEGLVELGVVEFLAAKSLEITKGDLGRTSILLLWVSGVFSAFVDNIPYVATMIPLIKNIGQQMGEHAIDPLWWSLSLGACFGGNGTLIGASANVVGAGIAQKSGYNISFLEFTKYGALMTVITLVIASGYMYLRYFL